VQVDMFTKIFVVLSLAAVAQAITVAPGASLSCGNGLFCSMGETCMSNKQGAGAKLACSPHSNAVICSDRRHSCPTGSTCTHEICTPSDGGQPFKASIAKDAVSLGLRTYGKGIYIRPSDAPGTVNDAGSDICNLIAPDLANFCGCGSVVEHYSIDIDVNQTKNGTYGVAYVHCYSFLGDSVYTVQGLTFEPRWIDWSTPSGTDMWYGAMAWSRQIEQFDSGNTNGDGWDNLKEFKGQFDGTVGKVRGVPVDFQKSIRISGAGFEFYGRGVSATADFSVIVNKANVINIDLNVHACVNFGTMPVQNETSVLPCDKPNVVCSNQPGVHDLLGFANITVPLHVLSGTYDLTAIINANRIV